MVELRKPEERECERCGRREVWDADGETWRVGTDDDGERELGAVDCVHEWDIDGSYSPIK